MRSIALIPARKNSQRFPAKLLQKLGGKPVVWHTVNNARKTELFSRIVLATDSVEIADAVRDCEVEIFFSNKEHACGSDRIAEAAATINDADLFLNIQADEPFLHRPDLANLLALFQDKRVNLASMMRRIDAKEAENPDRVKVVVDNQDFALYFSRTKIPYYRETTLDAIFWQHIGIYAFTPESLRAFSALQAGSLELAEKLECLRFLEYGLRCKMLRSKHNNLSIDSPADLLLAEAHLSSYKL